MWKKMAEVQCSLLHDQPMWPIHGQYQCRVCGRKYAVPWAQQAGKAERPRPTLRSAALDAGH